MELLQAARQDLATHSDSVLQSIMQTEPSEDVINAYRHTDSNGNEKYCTHPGEYYKQTNLVVCIND